MCQTAIVLISKALSSVESAEMLLKIKSIIALFIQTMVVSLARGLSLPGVPWLNSRDI